MTIGYHFNFLQVLFLSSEELMVRKKFIRNRHFGIFRVKFLQIRRQGKDNLNPVLTIAKLHMSGVIAEDMLEVCNQECIN